MASKIILKKSNVASKVPVVGDLDYGELALNYTDGKLWYKNNSDVITQLNAGISGTVTVAQGGTGQTSFTTNGILYASGSTTLANGSVLTFNGTTLGVNSINIGRGAGSIATNTAIGTSALNANTIGDWNTAVGYQTLLVNTSNGANTAIGYNVLKASTGTANTGVGASALSNHTTADSNTAVGYNSLLNNKTGGTNTAVGTQTLSSNVTGNNNTAIGSRSLLVSGATVTAGSFVTGTSYTIQTPGTTNFTLIGAANSTAGTVFTATGPGTGDGTASSNISDNVAVGFEAYSSNTTGINGVAIGSGASKSNTTGSNNVAVGFEGSFSNTTGTQNTVVGFRANKANITGSNNTAIGWNALLNNTTGSNIAIGSNAGSLITSGANNTIIGAFNGNYAGLNITTLNGYIVLSDGLGNPRLYADNSGNINIPSLTASKVLFTDASKNLTSTGTVPVASGGTGLTTISALSVPVANVLNTFTTITPAAGQSIRINASNTAWEAYTPGTGGAAASWSKKTTAYTAVSGDKLIGDTSGGAFSITLPATPAVGNFVEITDGADWFTTNLTVLRNGSTIEGGADDVLLNVKGITVYFVYDGTTWQVTATLGKQGAGGDVTLTGTQTLTNKTITGFKETRIAINTNIDILAGNYFTKQITDATTLTVSNVPAAGTVASFILDLTNGGVATVTWWANLKWVDGIAPALTISGRDSLGFFTHDGGTTWTGLVLGKDIK